MNDKKILEPFRIMANCCPKLKGKQKFQILTMISVDDCLKEKVYINSFKHGKSVLDEHSERKAYEENNDSDNIILFTTIAPCDHCYKYFIFGQCKIKKIYYLSDRLQGCKKSLNDDRIISLEKLFKDTEYETEVQDLINKLLLDYYNWKCLKKGGDYYGKQPCNGKKID